MANVPRKKDFFSKFIRGTSRLIYVSTFLTQKLVCFDLVDQILGSFSFSTDIQIFPFSGKFGKFEVWGMWKRVKNFQICIVSQKNNNFYKK